MTKLIKKFQQAGTIQAEPANDVTNYYPFTLNFSPELIAYLRNIFFGQRYQSPGYGFDEARFDAYGPDKYNDNVNKDGLTTTRSRGYYDKNKMYHILKISRKIIPSSIPGVLPDTMYINSRFDENKPFNEQTPADTSFVKHYPADTEIPISVSEWNHYYGK